MVDQFPKAGPRVPLPSIAGKKRASAPEEPASFAFNWVSPLKFDGISFSVSAQDSDPFGITFSTDGTKMYVVGSATDAVYEYQLTIGFDLSTATAVGVVSFSVAGQDTIPRGITFNPDGTRMYIVGGNSQAVFQYQLGVGFDLSTATAVGVVSFSTSGQTFGPQGIAFSADGTRMYVAESFGDSVLQYQLGVGFDLTTATAVGFVRFSVSAQDSDPEGIAFSTDGTKMYVVGSATDAVYQYQLGVGFDLTTATAAGIVNFSVGAEDTVPTGVVFNTDGALMYIVGSDTDSVYQYSINEL